MIEGYEFWKIELAIGKFKIEMSCVGWIKASAVPRW
jgi:hypothetical protein